MIFDVLAPPHVSNSHTKGRVTVLYYKWPTFTVKNQLQRNPSKILPNDT